MTKVEHRKQQSFKIGSWVLAAWVWYRIQRLGIEVANTYYVAKFAAWPRDSAEARMSLQLHPKRTRFFRALVTMFDLSR